MRLLRTVPGMRRGLASLGVGLQSCPGDGMRSVSSRVVGVAGDRAARVRLGVARDPEPWTPLARGLGQPAGAPSGRVAAARANAPGLCGSLIVASLGPGAPRSAAPWPEGPSPSLLLIGCGRAAFKFRPM